MSLVIHDLRPSEWEKICRDYEGWTVVSDEGTIRPCVGCFSCWTRNPGHCVISDGYENMGALIHHADEVVVISRYTYGGFSGFVKNVFDRCLAYVLPHLEIIDGETHHKKRYDEKKAFTFLFYGKELSEKEKKSACRYVQAVCINIRGYVKEVIFKGTEWIDLFGEATAAENVVKEKLEDETSAEEVVKEEIEDVTLAEAAKEVFSFEKVLLINGSMRSKNSNSAVLAKQLAGMLEKETEIVALKDYGVNFKAGCEEDTETGCEEDKKKACEKDLSDLLDKIEKASEIVLCFPLYVDGLPSQVIRFMEWMEKNWQGGSKRIYVLSNMGLYESQQLVNLFCSVRQWCSAMGFVYCGGLGVSAGELIGTMMRVTPFGTWPTQRVAAGMKKLREVIDGGTMLKSVHDSNSPSDRAKNLYAEPFCFPRSIYIHIANFSWNNTARKNGLKPRDLYRLHQLHNPSLPS